jgi:hypothetical protein
MCQSCQTWPAQFGKILLRTDTRLVFCNRKLMRTDIFFTRTTKPICNFTNSDRTFLSTNQSCVFLNNKSIANQNHKNNDHQSESSIPFYLYCNNYAMTLTFWRPALKFLVHMATVHCQFVRHMPKWCSNITDIVIVIPT